MKRIILLLAFCPLMAACGETRTVIYDNSPDAKFAGMLGGTPGGSDSSGQWQITKGGAPLNAVPNDPNHPVSAQALKIAELLRNQRLNPYQPAPKLSGGPNDNPGYKIETSFETPDATTKPKSNPSPPATGPARLPSGTWNTPAP